GSFKCSIRTHGEIDASEIAGRLGGGGHAGAAACTMNLTKGKATNLLLKEVQAELEA
ncbi:MAG: bifunctional oligoribonuclease/PAP phosphatase NrnA, partial [Clostridia bacterium]|nr:bifunctional oligoribonuclease/PAP phosphatase NrnA [Clostridia bacterium]